MASATRPANATPRLHSLSSWLPGTPLVAVAALGAVALTVAARRIAGALDQPPTARSTLLAILGVVALSTLAREAAWRWPLPARSPLRPTVRAAAGWGATAAGIVLLLALSLPRPTVVSLALWLAWLAADHWQRREWEGRRNHPGAVPPLAPTQPIATVAQDLQVDSLASEDVQPAGDVLQSLVRRRDEAGMESIAGAARAEFQAGQRHALVDLGFCPPLSRLPEIEAEPVDGPEAEVRVLHAYAHGVQLEVKLAAPAAAPCVVEIGFTATAASG